MILHKIEALGLRPGVVRWWATASTPTWRWRRERVWSVFSCFQAKPRKPMLMPYQKEPNSAQPSLSTVWMNSCGDTMNLSQRLTWWRERRRHHPPDEIHRAGELAEQRLAKISRAQGRTTVGTCLNPFVFPTQNRAENAEIDLVIVGGNTLLVVEQKHWSGSFEINGDEEFIQHRKNGTTHNHSTVNQRIARKSRMLLAMHKERVGQDDGVEVESCWPSPTGTWTGRRASWTSEAS